ncbi:putative holin-like toxin [Streptococcus salivarius]
MLGIGSFTIALIGLCHKLFKNDDKKIIRPHFWRSKTDYFRLKLAIVF